MDLQKEKIIEALNENNFSVALAQIQELEKSDPENFEYHIIYGDILFKMSNFKMAYEKYEKAMRINPASPSVYIKLGATNVQLENWKESINHFKTALGLDQNNVESKGYYGWALWNYAKQQNDKHTKNKAFEFLSAAKNGGLEMRIVNNALAEYHIDNISATWPIVEDEKGVFPIATKIEHVIEAEKELNKASTLIDRSNDQLNIKYNDAVSYLDGLKKREFNGYPFVRNAGIIGGIIMVLIGNSFFGVVLLLLAGLYVHSNMCPGYVANKKLLKGKTKNPFWVNRINEVGRMASSISFFGSSFAQVFFLGWLVGFVARVIQYSMAIFLLPFLVLAGYVSNYDLLVKVKQLSNT